MKRSLLIAMIVVVLAGGGLAAWQLMKNASAPPATTTKTVDTNITNTSVAGLDFDDHLDEALRDLDQVE